MTPESWQKLKSVFHAALELEPEERAALLARECDGDKDLRCRVERLLASHNESGDFLALPALVDAGFVTNGEFETGDGTTRVGERIGPYEIIREIGHGGMGTVFLAVRADDQYRKEVAIKLVNRGMDTDTILRRFVMERQILANLEHPNIAGLLEGGTTVDGLPYFVMEYVEGEPIDEYCDSRSFPIAQRLELFRQVCAGLHYAHQNLVVHRDIKPSNILVTAEGVPKLLDFGIAKLLSPDWSQTGDATLSMQRLMTPAYASPEQLRGLPITTAADVYSLGVVLYELLSGHHPYRSTSRVPEEMAQVILREEPERPSTAAGRQPVDDSQNGNENYRQRTTDNGPLTRKTNPKSKIQNPKLLRGDLDNIVLKALRREPERRYTSVQEFAEDIRRHLEGLPVTASPDTFSYRAEKFIQRNRAAVAAAAVVVIILLTATFITAWQARVARMERAKAERRFNDVRKLANSVVFELHDSIQNLPGSTPSRELLVSRALEYLDKLVNEAGQELSLQLELAAAYDKIGDIQGGFGTSHLGQRQKAGESYRKALAIRELVVKAEPTSVDFRRKLATSYTKLGEILWIEVDMNGALEFYGKALAINKALAAEMPNDPQIRSDLAMSYGKFGYMHAANGRADEALENTRKALILMQELAVADPNNTKIQAELAISYDRVAEILTALTKNHSEALFLFRKSQKIGETLLASDPLNTKLRRGQGVGDFNVATVSAKLGDSKTGLDSARKALSVFTEMLSEDPQNEEFRQIVAAIQTFVCEMMIKNGDAEEAIKLLSRSLLTLEKSFAVSPTDEIAHFRIANVQAELGKGHAALAADGRTPMQNRLSHWREARSWLQKSQRIYKTFLDAGKLSGDDAARQDVVIEEIAKCDAAIARQSGNY
jgi:serine/threonine protein kinase/tetratricopeptide (TPR) repeat protein